MDYYEELGVHRVAQVEEIRRAWRNLARLLHPDQQQEEGLRLLAEKQMKRLNEICAVLTDPVERLRYDRSLAALPPPRPPVRPRPNWMLAAALAVIAIAAAVLYPGRTARHTASREPASVAGAVALSTPTPVRRHTTRRGDPPAPLPRRQESASTKALVVPVEPPPEIQATIPDPPPSPDLPSAALAQPAQEPAPGIAGAWFYAPPKSSPETTLLYLPEFIEMFVSESAGAIHGRYRARYKVGDRPISGDVRFSFEGRRLDGPVVLVWTGSEGASGEIRLKLLADDTLQVDWHATEFGNSVGLASGAAILTRRRGL
jgi:hypothetical protein